VKSKVRILLDPHSQKRLQPNAKENQNVLVNFPEDPAAACENIFYKLDEDSKPDVKEVVVQAKSHDELSEKMEAIKELSPDTVVLNGTIRSFESIMDTL
jgi:hypothetical protein